MLAAPEGINHHIEEEITKSCLREPSNKCSAAAGSYKGKHPSLPTEDKDCRRHAHSLS